MAQEVYRSIEHPVVTAATDLLIAEIGQQLGDLQRLELSPDIRDARTSMVRGKIIHIMDCVRAGRDIAAADGSIDPALADVLAVTHDLARFEQAVRYGTYSDTASGYIHAHHGAEKFRASGLDVAPAGWSSDDIYEAIYWHSAYRYPGTVTAARLARDLDKLALMRRYDYIWRTDKGVHNGKPVAPPTDAVIDAYRMATLIPNDTVVTTGDAYLRMAAWQFDLNFAATRTIIDRERLIPTILSRAVTGPLYEELLAVRP